ncbi:MAG: hypothetical protein ABII27_04890 [bacterium]
MKIISIIVSISICVTCLPTVSTSKMLLAPPGLSHCIDSYTFSNDSKIQSIIEKNPEKKSYQSGLITKLLKVSRKNRNFKLWAWLLQPIIALSIGPIIFGALFALFPISIPSYFLHWFSVSIFFGLQYVFQSNKRHFDWSAFFFSIGTGSFGPLVGISNLPINHSVVLFFVGLMTVAIRAIHDISITYEEHSSIDTNGRRKVLKLIGLTGASIVGLSIGIIKVLDYVSLSSVNIGEFQNKFFQGIEKASHSDYSSIFPWFDYLEVNEKRKDLSPFRRFYGTPENFAFKIVRLHEIKKRDRNIIPLAYLQQVKAIRRLPDSYRQTILQVSNKYNRPPELYVSGMINAVANQYTIDHALFVLKKRQSQWQDFIERLKQNWPQWLLNITFSAKLVDLFGGIVFEANNSMGVFQIRPAMVKRYLNSINGLKVDETTENKKISIALLNPITNIHAYSAILEKVLTEVENHRSGAVKGIMPDVGSYYRESRSEMLFTGGDVDLEALKAIPEKAIMGSEDWILGVYHLLYHMKFYFHPDTLALSIVSGIFNDKPALFDINDLEEMSQKKGWEDAFEKDLDNLISAQNDSDPYIRDAAEETIRIILSNGNLHINNILLGRFKQLIKQSSRNVPVYRTCFSSL